MKLRTLASCLAAFLFVATGCGGGDEGLSATRDSKAKPAKSRGSAYARLSVAELESKLVEFQRKVSATQEKVRQVTTDYQKASKDYSSAAPDAKPALLIAKSKAEAAMKNAIGEHETANRDLEIAQRVYVEKLRTANP